MGYNVSIAQESIICYPSSLYYTDCLPSSQSFTYSYICYFQQEGAKFTYCDLLDNFEKNLQSRSRVENSDEATTVEKGIKSLKIIFTDFEKRKKANELNKQESAPAPKIRRIRKKKETTLIVSFPFMFSHQSVFAHSNIIANCQMSENLHECVLTIMKDLTALRHIM